jgi:hypothetical protein
MPNFSVDDLVLGLQGFAAIATLTLRSPQHVTKAVDAGALDLASRRPLHASPSVSDDSQSECSKSREQVRTA